MFVNSARSAGAALVRAIVLIAAPFALAADIHADAPRAEFLVTTTNDTVDAAPGNSACADIDGKCSLRAAIIEANALGVPSYISIPTGNYVLTRKGKGEDAALKGDLDITTSLTIYAPFAQKVTIDGSQIKDRVFHALGDTLVYIDNVTIIGGNVLEKDDEDTLPGGGILLQNGTIVNSRIIGNKATNGGGVACVPCIDLTLTNVVFEKNSVTGFLDSQSGGGGLHVRGGVVEFENVTFNKNKSIKDGGGAYLEDITNGTVRGLTATDNTASYGGGILLVGSTLDLSNALVTGNRSGGLYARDSTFSLTRALIGNNIGLNGGGMFVLYSVADLDGVSLVNNVAAPPDGGFSGSGGGIDIISSTLTMQNSTVSGNTTGYFGAINIYGAEATTFYSVMLTNVTVTENQISSDYEFAYGGITGNFFNGEVTIVNSIVAGNEGGQCGAGVNSGGGNVFATPQDCANHQASDIDNAVDPLLGPLVIDSQDGLAAVHIPEIASPALNNGAGTCLEFDQRRVERPLLANECDSGAVEGADAPFVINGSFEDADGNKRPDGWKVKGLSADKLQCAKSLTGNHPAAVGTCAMVFTDPVGKLTQTITVTGVGPLDMLVYGALIDSSSKQPQKPIIIAVSDAGTGEPLFKAFLETFGATDGYEPLYMTSPTVNSDVTVKISIGHKGMTGKLAIDGVWMRVFVLDERHPGSRNILPPPAAPAGFRSP